MYDSHVHSTFSDGKDSPEDIVLEAISRGLEVLGFSDHAYTSFDTSYCIKKEELCHYNEEIERLKVKYADKIIIKRGIEADRFSTQDLSGYDFVIGSCHYMQFGNEFVPVDESPEVLKRAAEKYCNSDMISLCEKYFETVSGVTNLNPTFIGHFDLIMKFNENGELFDINDPRYICAWRKSALRILEKCNRFEINFGAIPRGYRTTPYPDIEIIEFLHKCGAEFILASDAHSKEDICYFSKWSVESGF